MCNEELFALDKQYDEIAGPKYKKIKDQVNDKTSDLEKLEENYNLTEVKFQTLQKNIQFQQKELKKNDR